MMKLVLYALLSFLVQGIASQQISDVWETTSDRKSLLSSVKDAAINFTQADGDADIAVDDTKKYQSIVGYGGSLTDSAALTLNNLKKSNADEYKKVLQYMFDPTDGANAGGLSYIRVSIGASDFSSTTYSLDDTSGDTSFRSFKIDRAPAYLFSVLQDILAVNKGLKVHICPWSPPGWMKDGGTMNGGSLKSNMVQYYPTYLLKAVQGFQNKNIPIHAISIQNEPENTNPTYPSCKMTAAIEGQIGTALRKLLDSNKLNDVKVVGFEHNWKDAGGYPVQLMQKAQDAFDGVAFHCYEGSVDQQDQFQAKFPKKDIYFTECTGTIGSDFWKDLQWYIQNLWIGGLQHGSINGLMWNVALDDKGQPVLPGSSSCKTGCRAIVSITSDGKATYNQEFYSMAQFSKAVSPKDSGGPVGQRIGVTVGGSNKGSLTVGAFVTPRTNSTEERYSVVVLNTGSNSLKTTIGFRGSKATYTFPVGVTTLSWLAASAN